MFFKLLIKNKNFIFFSFFFLLVSFLIKTEFKLSESFFLIGIEKLNSNLVRTIFFFSFIPVVAGSGIFFLNLLKKLKTNSYGDNFKLDFLIGFCFLTILGFFLGIFNLLNYQLILIIFILFSFNFFKKYSFRQIFNKEIFLYFLILLIFCIYKYIYPETWSLDSYHWYTYILSGVSQNENIVNFIDSDFYHPWYSLRGNGVPLMWAIISDGSVTRLISVYCLFFSFLFLKDLLKETFLSQKKNEFFQIIIFCLSFFVLFGVLSNAEYQKFHFFTLFFISGFYWLIIKNYSLLNFKFQSILLILILSTTLDKTYTLFYFNIIYFFSIFYHNNQKLNLEKKLKSLIKFFLTCSVFVILIFIYNWNVAGLFDGYMWETMIKFKNETIFSKYFDQDLLSIWTHSDNFMSEKIHFISELNIFAPINPILSFGVWLILFIFLLTNKTLKKLVFFKNTKSKINLKKINLIIPLIIYTISYSLSVSPLGEFGSLQRYHHFAMYFGLLSFVTLVLTYVEAVYTYNFLLLKKNIEKLLIIFIIPFLVLAIIFFDRTSSSRMFLKNNSFIYNKQILYFVGKLSSSETVNRDRFDIGFCRDIEKMIPENSKILLVTLRNDCRGIPFKRPDLFLHNYKKIKIHLYEKPSESYAELKKAGFTHFVFDSGPDNDHNVAISDDLSIYYRAFDKNTLKDRFYMFYRNKNMLIITNKKNGGKKMNEDDIKFIELIKRKNNDHLYARGIKKNNS